MSNYQSRVQRQRKTDAARRRVRTVGAQRIGQRTVIPQAKPPKRKRPKYQTAGMLGAFSGLLTTLAMTTGSLVLAVGSLATAASGCASAYFEYRRDLIEVKRTGRPIGSTDAPPKPKAKPERPAVDLAAAMGLRDQPPAPVRSAAQPRTNDQHLTRCKAKPPGGPTCRCPDGPNRKGKTGRKR